MKTLAKLERVFLAIGIVLLAVFALATLRSSVLSRMSTAKFEAVKEARTASTSIAPNSLETRVEVDFALWSPKRITAYRQTLLSHVDTPMAVLRIERLNIDVPVLEGTDELALNRGVGWIEGTTRPGGDGNVGIAGHRDGFFRALKDIQIGDSIELMTIDSVARYEVDEVRIVTPQDSNVLVGRSKSSLTLVTCYPFYFVGDAPNRFIVQASVVGSNAGTSEMRSELAR